MGHASLLAITGLGSDSHALVVVVQRSTHSAISVEGFGRSKETWMLGIGKKKTTTKKPLPVTVEGKFSKTRLACFCFLSFHVEFWPSKVGVEKKKGKRRMEA